MSYMIGVDGGSESLRAFVFDLEGRPRGSHATAYKTDFPQPSWAEQDPEDWWQALGASIKAALVQANVVAAEVIALCVDTTCCSVVTLDRDGRPLRPAMIWMDVRSARQADAIAATKDPALRVNGAGAGPVSAEWMIPKSLWIKENQRQLFDRAEKIGEFEDYLNLRLTGRWVGSLNNMSVRWHYQSDHGGRPVSLLSALELEDLIDKWPKEVIAPGSIIGPLTSTAAEHLGLMAGTPVVQSGADAFIGMVGLGVTEPGEMAMITGSSHLASGCRGKARSQARCVGHIHGCGLSGQGDHRGRANIHRIRDCLVQAEFRTKHEL